MIKLPKLRPELRIALLYGVFGGLWILLSDRVVNSLVGDPQRLAELQTYKGWLFVLLSTLLIYALPGIRRLERDLPDYEALAHET